MTLSGWQHYNIVLNTIIIVITIITSADRRCQLNVITSEQRCGVKNRKLMVKNMVCVTRRQDKSWRRSAEGSRQNWQTCVSSWMRRVHSWKSCRLRWTNVKRNCSVLWIGRSIKRHQLDRSLSHCVVIVCHSPILSHVALIHWLKSNEFSKVR